MRDMVVALLKSGTAAAGQWGAVRSSRPPLVRQLPVSLLTSPSIAAVATSRRRANGVGHDARRDRRCYWHRQVETSAKRFGEELARGRAANLPSRLREVACEAPPARIIALTMLSTSPSPSASSASSVLERDPAYRPSGGCPTAPPSTGCGCFRPLSLVTLRCLQHALPQKPTEEAQAVFRVAESAIRVCPWLYRLLNKSAVQPLIQSGKTLALGLVQRPLCATCCRSLAADGTTAFHRCGHFIADGPSARVLH